MLHQLYLYMKALSLQMYEIGTANNVWKDWLWNPLISDILAVAALTAFM